MTSRKSFLYSAAILIAAAAPALAQPAAAPAQASIAVGAQVSDTAGGAVGTIASIDGDHVILKTDKHDVRLPVASFTKVDNGYIMAMTQAEVNAAVEQSLAEAAALMTVGAQVRGPEGGAIGTIDAIDDQFVTLKLADGLVKLPRAAVGADASGPVIGMTAAELKAAVAAAAPAE